MCAPDTSRLRAPRYLGLAVAPAGHPSISDRSAQHDIAKRSPPRVLRARRGPMMRAGQTGARFGLTGKPPCG